MLEPDNAEVMTRKTCRRFVVMDSDLSQHVPETLHQIQDYGFNLSQWTSEWLPVHSGGMGVTGPNVV